MKLLLKIVSFMVLINPKIHSHEKITWIGFFDVAIGIRYQYHFFKAAKRILT